MHVSYSIGGIPLIACDSCSADAQSLLQFPMESKQNEYKLMRNYASAPRRQHKYHRDITSSSSPNAQKKHLRNEPCADVTAFAYLAVCNECARARVHLLAREHMPETNLHVDSKKF